MSEEAAHVYWVGDWCKLIDLRQGAVFMTDNGIIAMKTEYRTFNDGAQCDCYLVESGEAAHFKDGNNTQVREINVDPVKVLAGLRHWQEIANKANVRAGEERTERARLLALYEQTGNKIDEMAKELSMIAAWMMSGTKP